MFFGGEVFRDPRDALGPDILISRFMLKRYGAFSKSRDNLPDCGVYRKKARETAGVDPINNSSAAVDSPKIAVSYRRRTWFSGDCETCVDGLGHLPLRFDPHPSARQKRPPSRR